MIHCLLLLLPAARLAVGLLRAGRYYRRLARGPRIWDSTIREFI